MILRHLRLPGLTSYSHADNIQQRLVRNLLAHKASSKTTTPPPPTIITAQFTPTYTCGRREVGHLTKAQIEYLTSDTKHGKAEFHEALRGGQTTFHGPGQLIAYPIIDLKRHGLSARCYVHFLEQSIINLLQNTYGISTTRTDNPGVWTDEQHKICALGVHLRRNVTSHGVGLNVRTELAWFDRIVACGLEGKKTTSMMQQRVDTEVQKVGGEFVEQFAERLEGVEAIEAVREEDFDIG